MKARHPSGWEVGMTIVFLHRHGSKPQTLTVEKVGRRWLTCGRFRIDAETMVGDVTRSAGRAYASMEEYEEIQASSRLWHQLRNAVNRMSRPDIAATRAAMSALGIEEEPLP